MAIPDGQIDDMGVKITDVQGMLCLKCNVCKFLTWLRPRRESFCGRTSTDRLARSLLGVLFWVWQDGVSSGVPASVSVDLLCSTNLSFVSSVACCVLSKALFLVDH